MKRAIMGVALMLGVATVSTACAQNDPFESARTACIDLNEEIYPDGLENPEDGETYDAERICDSTAATQGREEFTEFFNDPARVHVYRKAQLRLVE